MLYKHFSLISPEFQFFWTTPAVAIAVVIVLVVAAIVVFATTFIAA